MSSRPSPIDPRWTLAHLMLLSGFSRGRAPEPHDSGHSSEQWKAAIGETHAEAVRHFAEAGLLILGSLSDHLTWKFSDLELKQMLRERGLNLLGRKAEKAKRLAAADSKAVEQAVAGLRVWKCTEEGERLAFQFFGLRENMEMAAFESLQSKRFENAVRIVCDFKDALGFPKEQFFRDRPELEDFRTLFSVRPKILAGISEDALDHLRIAAGMGFLMLDYRRPEWLPPGFSVGLPMSNQTAMLMLIGATQVKLNLVNFRNAGIFRVRISGGHSEMTCDGCKALIDTVWPIDEVPELPYSKCTSGAGCRCFLSPVLPRKGSIENDSEST